jgi:hypothetical protein
LAPTGRTLVLNAIASATAPITILGVDVAVFSKQPIKNGTRIQCGFGAGGYPGETIYADLDHPQSPITMQDTTVGTNDPRGALATMPPANIVIAANQGENPVIDLSGTDGYVYSYSMTFHLVENGQTVTKRFGNSGSPYLVAFDPVQPGSGGTFVDWDYAAHKWVPAKNG